MCEYCHCYPHLHGCPNEVIPTYRTCKNCGDDIPIGYRIVDIDGDIYCEDCINDMSAEELLALFDCRFEENEAPEPDYDPEPDWDFVREEQWLAEGGNS